MANQSINTGVAVVEDTSAMEIELARQRRYSFYPDGQAESVAEHSLMLGMAAVEISIRLYPTLDLGKIALLSIVHDLPEVYGDTPTLGISSDGIAQKKAKEAEGLLRLAEDYPNSVGIIGIAASYDAERPDSSAEERLVFIVDKILASAVHLKIHGKKLREYGITNREELLAGCAQTISRIEQFRNEFPELIGIWWEMFEMEVRALESFEETTPVLLQSPDDSVSFT